MPEHISDCTILNNGVKMPWLGLGVYKAKEGDEVVGAFYENINRRVGPDPDHFTF